MYLIYDLDFLYWKILCSEDIQLNAVSMQKMPLKDSDLGQVLSDGVSMISVLHACENQLLHQTFLILSSQVC